MSENNENKLLNKSTWLVLLLLFLAACVYFYGWEQRQRLEQELATKEKYKNALLAEMRIYKDKSGVLYNQKLSLQTSLVQLEADNEYLSKDRKELLSKIKNSSNKNNIIAAGLLKTVVKTKYALVQAPTLVTDSTVSFVSKSDSINFAATVKNVKALEGKTPSLSLDSISLKNSLYVQYDWGTRKNGYPVSFTVTNSNPLFKTTNIESYVIPELSKETLKPNFFQKLGTGIRTHGIVFGAGVLVGGAGAIYLIKK